MFAFTGAAIGNTNALCGRSKDGESSGEAVGLTEVMAISTRVICDHWGVIGRVEVADVSVCLEGNMLGKGPTVPESAFEVGHKGTACGIDGWEKGWSWVCWCRIEHSLWTCSVDYPGQCWLQQYVCPSDMAVKECVVSCSAAALVLASVEAPNGFEFERACIRHRSRHGRAVGVV